MDCRLWKEEQNRTHLVVRLHRGGTPNIGPHPCPPCRPSSSRPWELLLFSHFIPPPNPPPPPLLPFFFQKKNWPPFFAVPGHRQLVLHLNSSPTLKSSLNDLARYGCNNCPGCGGIHISSISKVVYRRDKGIYPLGRPRTSLYWDAGPKNGADGADKKYSSRTLERRSGEPGVVAAARIGPHPRR